MEKHFFLSLGIWTSSSIADYPHSFLFVVNSIALCNIEASVKSMALNKKLDMLGGSRSNVT
jgi:hypothetical protein